MNTNKLSSSIIIGIDAEWQLNITKDENTVISYQWYCKTPDNEEWGGLIIVPDGKRITLSQWISLAIIDGHRKGKLQGWPKNVYLTAHYTVAEMSVLRDFEKWKYSFDHVRKSFVTIMKPAICKVYDASRNIHEVGVRLFDTLLLSPQGKQSLEALGDLHGIQKIELPDGIKERMGELLIQGPELFEKYAVRDAEICANHLEFMFEFSSDLGLSKVPATLGGLAVAYTEECWKEIGLSVAEVSGTESIKDSRWNSSAGRPITKTKIVPIAARSNFEKLAIECYHGGRNEMYVFGPTEKALFTDYDLCGAYTTGMAALRVPDFDKTRVVINTSEFSIDELGLAHISFKFPSSTLFPCLPVRTDNGLIFPLEGETYVGSPEIILALNLGAEIDVKLGVIVPWKNDEIRPFERVITKVNEMRSKYEKGGLRERLWKEIGNSLYGKLAQGLQEKRVFNSRAADMEDMPPNKITNPFLAAYVTSLVRAVLGEVLAAIPPNRVVVSATTDGFLTNATSYEIFGDASAGELCQYFSTLRMRLVGEPDILEIKHKANGMVGVKTRFQMTHSTAPGEKPILARVGIRPPKVSIDDQNDYVVSLFENRTEETMVEDKNLTNFRDIFDRGADLISVERKKRVALEYDWKRCADDPLTRPIRTTNHLAFETKPWQKVEDFRSRRDCADEWRKRKFPALKSISDLDRFNEFCDGAVLSKSGLRRSVTGGSQKIALRMFLRAFVRSEWGLSQDAMSYREIARWLTEGGYCCTRNDLKNAARANSRLVEHQILPTAEVCNFLVYVKQQFPNFECEKLLIIDTENTRLDLSTPSEVYRAIPI
jgi:hypothetical protein